jgi:arylsulfatase A-like enzyme
MKRVLIKPFLLLVSTLSTFAQERPNIILMMADDLGWGDPGYNNGWISTPTLDAMAASGLRFDRFYAASAVCSPTRASCLTGRNPYRVGVPTANAGKLGADETPLSEVLKGVGYATGHFGKWHLGTMTTLRRDSNRGAAGNTADYSPPWQHGYDFCFATEAKVPTFHPMRRSQNGLPEPLSFTDPNFYGTRYWTPPALSTTAEGTPVAVSDNLSGDDSRVIMDRVIPFVRNAVATGDPFFTVIWFHTPHKPLTDPDGVSGVDSNDAYTDAITGMDTQIARLRAELDALGVTDNSMFWFCSDNGPEDGVGSSGPFRERKRSLHEGGVRVPGILVWPAKVTAGRTTDFPVVTSDYYPTILDYLGLNVAGQKPLDGISLRGLIENTATTRADPIGFRFESQRSWVNQQYKLLSKDNGATYLLYDLLGDPSEQTDIASAHPEIVARMSQELQTWLAAVVSDTEYVPPPDDVTVVLSTPRNQVAGEFPVTIAFSRSVTDLTPDDFIVSNGAVVSLDGAGAAYELDVAPTAPGEVTVWLPADRVIDAENHPNLASNTVAVVFGETIPPAPGRVVIDDHFDDGTTDGWKSQGNNRSATHRLSEADSLLSSEVAAAQTDTNYGAVSTFPFDPRASDGFVVTVVVDSVDQKPDANGFFIGIVGDNSVFYRDASTRNFGLTFFGLDSRTNSEAGFGLNYGDNFGTTGAALRLADGDAQLGSFLDGFTATVGVDRLQWRYEITGLNDPGGNPVVFTGNGSWIGVGADFDELFGSDPSWFAVQSNQKSSLTTHTVRLQRVRLTEGPEPPPRVLGLEPDLPAGQATLRWEAVEGRRYRIERSPDLTGWLAIGETTALLRVIDFVDTDADSHRVRSFYRTRLLFGE